MFVVPAQPGEPTIVQEDFSLVISFNLVDGATFYTAQLNESIMANNFPIFFFKNLLSGENYNIYLSATKVTSYGNFTSRTRIANTSTS